MSVRRRSRHRTTRWKKVESGRQSGSWTILGLEWSSTPHPRSVLLVAHSLNLRRQGATERAGEFANIFLKEISQGGQWRISIICLVRGRWWIFWAGHEDAGPVKRIC
eukprot:scaffold35077_cov47-Prasinocladus_malaysianus.AAC.2